MTREIIPVKNYAEKHILNCKFKIVLERNQHTNSFRRKVFQFEKC